MSFKWALGFMRKKKWLLVLSIALNVLGVVLMTIEPFIFRDITDNILMPQKFDLLVPRLLLALAIGAGFMACRYFANMTAELASQEAVYNLKSELFDKLMRQSTGFYAENRTGDLINKCSGDVEMVNHFLCWVTPKWVEMALMLAFALVVFLSINPLYTLILFGITPLSAYFALTMGKKVRPAFSDARDQLSQLNTVVQENISGNRVVKAFVREKHELDKFQKENQEYKNLQIKANFIWLKYGPMIDSVAIFMSVLNLAVGGIMVCLGNITLGDLTLFLSFAWALNEPMILLGFLMNDTQRFLASGEKIMSLYNADVKIESPETDRSPETVKGDIELRDVTLKYGSVTVLDGINMKIPAGRTVGIMGPTGSGKTSLINLVSRFTDVTRGGVYIDGVNVKEWNLQKLRANIGMTMQDVFLFSDTVESNIAYGVPEAPMETVISAAKTADADSFVSTMPDGYDTIVGERGTGLSGGQKQRISLARALAKEAPVLILDDTTSAVDMETEQYIQKCLAELPKQATTIIIAQRTSSVMQADMIYIIEDGKISECGSHAELMQNPDGYYRNTCLLQNS